jgi:hypothetical protein
VPFTVAGTFPYQNPGVISGLIFLNINTFNSMDFLEKIITFLYHLNTLFRGILLFRRRRVPILDGSTSDFLPIKPKYILLIRMLRMISTVFLIRAMILMSNTMYQKLMLLKKM